MTRAKTKAPASQAKGAKSTAKKSRTGSARKSQAAASATKPTQGAQQQIEALDLDQTLVNSPASLQSAPLEEPSAIQKGRQPKHINSTQAIAIGTAAAGVSHLFGWL